MLPILDPYFSGRFKPYAQGVTLVTSTKKPTLDNFMQDPNGLMSSIQNFALAQHVTKPRAQASIWHMHYTLRILPSILASHSLLTRPLPLALEAVYWDPQLQQLQLLHQGDLRPKTKTFDRYEELIFDHFAPLHLWLHKHFSIAPKVLWSNCAFRINHFLTTIESAIGPNTRLKNDKSTLLTQSKLGDRINPLYKKTIIINSHTGSYQLRNECCLLHKLPAKHYCNDCPKLSHHIVHYALNKR
jgi:siderophore-iron reductase FhuF